MKKIILIDGNNLLFRSYYATAYSGSFMRNSKGMPTNALYGFVNMIKKIIKEESPTHIMVAFDKGKTFRHLKYVDYKGGRSETPDELKSQFPYAKELCLSMGITYLEIDNYEADDIIGTFAKKIDESSDLVGLIVSSDKDLLQLISDKVTVKLLKTHDYLLMDKKAFYDTYQLDPLKIIDLKSLMGDASDNIPGVKGIGEKGALKLLQEYGSLDNIYANIDNIKGKVKDKLIASKDMAYLSYEIATIYREVPIDTNIDHILYLGDNDNYAKMLNELEFYSLLKQVDVKKEEVKLDYQIIDNLDNIIKEDNYAFYLETLGYNYHDDKILGISLISGNNRYFIPIELLYHTNFFQDNYHKHTYDLKKCLVVFDKYDIKVDNLCDDLMVSAYLLNKNIRTDISYLANQYEYDIMFYEKEFGSEITLKEPNIDIIQKEMIKKCQFIYDFKDKFLDELKDEEMLSLYNDIELPLVSVLTKMELDGVKVSSEYLEEIGNELEIKINTLSCEIYALAGEEFNINSPKQLGDILFKKMSLPYPKKVSKDNYSTSKDILDKLSADYPIIEKILLYRTYTKLHSNYIVSLKGDIKSDKRVHTIFNQTLTRTGRLSSERPNLQNIPVRLEEGRLIRKAFIPSDDSIIISSDYSQIELRVFAHMSNEKNLIDAFNNDLDIHTKTASDIFKVPISSVTSDMRRKAKAVNFGILYGISGFGLSEDLGINLLEAREFMDKYLATFPGIKEYNDSSVKEAYDKGYVKTLFNRKRIIEELHNKNYLIRKSGERMALNTPIQGTAADIIKMAMIKMAREIDKGNFNAKMVIQVHDELVFDVPKNEVQEFVPLIRKVMEEIYPLKVPLKVSLEYGNTWYEAK